MKHEKPRDFISTIQTSFLMREKKLYDASFRGDTQFLDELFREDELILNYHERPSLFLF
ncbi:hypothetical protein LguiB_018273 [Lonicera macranthoides]